MAGLSVIGFCAEGREERRGGFLAALVDLVAIRKSVREGDRGLLFWAHGTDGRRGERVRAGGGFWLSALRRG